MAKLTKKSYIRKRVIAGVAIFVAIALITTGIACWLLLNDYSDSADGNVHVASVAESALGFKDIKLNNGETSAGGVEGAQLVFDSQYGDDNGRVKWDGVQYESLTLKVSGTVTNAQYLGELVYTLDLPEGLIEMAAPDKNYVDISEFYDYETGKPKEIAVPYTAENFKQRDDGTTELRFEFSLSIKWGSYFKNTNPSVYFDTEYTLTNGSVDTQSGIYVPNDTVVSVLQEFYDTIKKGSAAMPQFTLTLTARTN